jgi:hypothetical protein
MTTRAWCLEKTGDQHQGSSGSSQQYAEAFPPESQPRPTGGSSVGAELSWYGGQQRFFVAHDFLLLLHPRQKKVMKALAFSAKSKGNTL